MQSLISQFAATIDAKANGVPKISSNEILQDGLGLVYWAAGITAVIVIIIGGILYATSEGEPQKVKRAKDAILYAVVGLVVVLMAFVVTQFIIGRF